MAFDFWALANDKSFQQEAINELNEASFKNFTEPGEYDVTITSAEQKLTKSGYPQISLRIKADTGESGFWNLLVGHDGGQSVAAKIAQQQLALIVKASGRVIRDPSQLNGVRLVVNVKMKEDNNGEPRPNFRCIGGAGQTEVPGAPAKPVTQRVAPKPAQAAKEFDPADDDIPF